MSGLSVIIPSRHVSNLVPCVRGLREHQSAIDIIVVDDGLAFRPVTEPPLRFAEGVKPFVFSRNVNIGISAAGENDIIILNDDAVLKTARGFSLLQSEAESHPEYGMIAASTNNVGNVNQRPKGIGLREDRRMVCFVCVLIPRRTIAQVGLLDERYIHYGMDDDDYCLRVRNAGLKIGIHDGCFVDHSLLQSSYRGRADASGDYRPNLKIFKEKWGMDNFGRPA